MIQTAMNLFNKISQDHELMKLFKCHSIRVHYMSDQLAKRIGCYDEDLAVAGLLHDIGKIGLSKEILLKPSQLSDLEYRIIQAHSHIGNLIVRKELKMPKAAQFIRDHHERWDGKGYPRGLKGEAISIQGRIIGICDAFDTMTVDRRTYTKNTLTVSTAFEELRQCSWSQFDGELVEEFIKIMQDDERLCKISANDVKFLLTR